MKNNFTVVCINICVFLFLLLGIEVLGQVAYFIKKGHPLIQIKKNPFELLFERHPYLGVALRRSAVAEENGRRITTTDIGTRWTGAAADDASLIRVALLGGSTTFGTRLTDADTWPALLQGLMGERYAVINYGVNGYSTVESIIQAALLVPEKDPDIVVFYGGWNDIANYHVPGITADFSAGGIKQIENNMEHDKFDHSQCLWFQISKRIFLVKLAQIIRNHLVKQNYLLPPGFNTPDPFVDKIYLRNLQTLKLLALGRNSTTHMIFVPQVLNYADFKANKNPRHWSPFINDNAMPALMDRFNKIMDNVCQPGEPRCMVVDNVLKVSWEPTDFIDDGHFSRLGGLKFAQMLAEKIKLIIERNY